MNAETAKSYIGKQVMSRDPGNWMIRYGPPHGPWTLKQVTKGGIAIIVKEGENGREERHVALGCILPIP